MDDLAVGHGVVAVAFGHQFAVEVLGHSTHVGVVAGERSELGSNGQRSGSLPVEVFEPRVAGMCEPALIVICFSHT